MIIKITANEIVPKDLAKLLVKVNLYIRLHQILGNYSTRYQWHVKCEMRIVSKLTHTWYSCKFLWYMYEWSRNYLLQTEEVHQISEIPHEETFWFVKVWVRSHFKSSGIWGGQSGTGRDFLRVLSSPLLFLISPSVPYSFSILPTDTI